MDEALRQAAAGKFDPANILNTEKPAGMANGGIVGAYANGGTVGGTVANGYWNQDSVVARYPDGRGIIVAGGEEIIKATSVNAETRPFLRSINETGALPRISLPVTPAPRAPTVDLTPLLNTITDLQESVQVLIDITAAAGDQHTEALAQVRDATAAVARETRTKRLQA
jgi:hypothetical protein